MKTLVFEGKIGKVATTIVLSKMKFNSAPFRKPIDRN